MSDAPTAKPALAPVVVVDKATADAADVHRLQLENTKMRAQLASLRAGGHPPTLLALDRWATTHDYSCDRTTAGVRHEVVMLNEDSRQVRCRCCGELLDAFEVLMGYAKGERQFSFGMDNAQAERTRLRADVEALTRSRKNLMAAVAKAKKMIRDGEAVAAAAIQAAARQAAEEAEAAAAARAAAEEKLRNGPLLELYDKPGDLPQ